MITNKRKIFLEQFLSLYGVEKIEINKVDVDKINGIAIYDDGESQEFCWHNTEQNVPSDRLIELIQVIKHNRFNQTDKIIIAEEILFSKLDWNDRTEFNKVYQELFDIKIKMIDDGEETDSYFIHL
jgi:hypothetical protein